jgi:general L-amino acid transport system substrate-binding protein
MHKRTLLLSTLLIALLALSFASVTAQTALGPITQRIIDRGEVICGANQTLVGFGSVNDAGEFEGFDVDFCRAVAVAVLGDATKVSFRPLTGTERQAAIQSGEIDLMIRNTTWTLSRDVTWGAIFGPTTFYDGQGVMVPVELGVSTIEELEGGSICVQTGTTTELNISDRIEGLDIELQVFPDAPSTSDAYQAGRCEGFTTDKSGLAATRATFSDPGAHVILDETLSKEPLGPLSPQSDPQFAEIIAWTVWGMVTAEEEGITSQNIDEWVQADGESDEAYIERVTAPVARLLGQANNPSGSYLGVSEDFVVNVIRQVGNYGEVYERNLPAVGIDRDFNNGANQLVVNGGLLFAPPFR